MAPALRRHLVLEVDARDAGPLVVLDGADHTDRVSVPGVGVRNHRDLHGAGDASRVVDHLRSIEQTHVGAAEERGRRPEPRHVEGREPRGLDEPRRQRVESAGRKDRLRTAQQLAQPRRRVDAASQVRAHQPVGWAPDKRRAIDASSFSPIPFAIAPRIAYVCLLVVRITRLMVAVVHRQLAF